MAALVVAGVVAVLIFPRSCSDNDAPPGTPAPANECPRASTVSGFVWPNVYAGFVAAPLLALAAGSVTYALVRRR